jgi:hypothetical protein
VATFSRWGISLNRFDPIQTSSDEGHSFEKEKFPYAAFTCTISLSDLHSDAIFQ